MRAFPVALLLVLLTPPAQAHAAVMADHVGCDLQGVEFPCDASVHVEGSFSTTIHCRVSNNLFAVGDRVCSFDGVSLRASAMGDPTPGDGTGFFVDFVEALLVAPTDAGQHVGDSLTAFTTGSTQVVCSTEGPTATGPLECSGTRDIELDVNFAHGDCASILVVGRHGHGETQVRAIAPFDACIDSVTGAGTLTPVG